MLSEQFQEIIESLKSADLFKIKKSLKQAIEDNSLNSFDSLRYKRFKEEIEKNFYLTLSKLLALMKFEDFRQLFNFSDKLGIFIDAKKIPFRFKIISDIHLNCIQSGQNGNIFKIIRFYNEYNLFKRDFTDKELELLKDIKMDGIFIANLTDLFGKISDSLIWYACKIIPYDLYLMFINNASTFDSNEFFARNYYNLSFLKKYFDRYSIYGLSVEKLGYIEDFIKSYEKAKNSVANRDLKLVKFRFRKKTHLVSINNISKIYNKILNSKEKYNFYSLSMVLLGGIGPQGHGFTYSTPRGEVIEICSDIKENEAIIIKYKQFLKKQFLVRLKDEMAKKTINNTIINRIINYLSELITNKETIHYYKKEQILRQITSFLSENLRNYYSNYIEFYNLMKKISNAIKIILRPIKMEDQFKTRMYLVKEDKIKSEDIAKLTSLKNKSHYNVLSERIFFQNEIKWFFKDYADDLLKFQNKL
ncbi:MAG: hypothetical protein ACFFAH_07025 [Promethearchaeota archaeon]